MAKRRRWGDGRLELEKKLSEACLEELIEKFGNRVIRVPTKSSLERAKRVRRAHAIFKADPDATCSEVADAIGCHKSTVVRYGNSATAFSVPRKTL